jgi:lipopolysaccharide export system protein LptA
MFFISAFCVFFSARLCADTITFTANTMSGFTGKKTEYTLLEGSAYVRTTKIEIRADKIELSGEDFRFVSASGSVRGKHLDDDMDFTCETLKYDRDREVVTMQNNASIVDNPNGVNAKAEIIQYNQQTGVALLQINIELRQKDSVCTAAFAIYRKQEQILEMSGNPKIEKGDDVFRAREVMMNLDTEEIRLDGRVRGTVVDSREEAPAEQTPSAEQPAGEPDPVDAGAEGAIPMPESETVPDDAGSQ